MKLWLDDQRRVPSGYTGARSVNEAKALICACERAGECIQVLDLDFDLGLYEGDGGDGLALLEWLAETERFYPVELHSSHPFGRAKMEDLLAQNPFPG